MRYCVTVYPSPSPGPLPMRAHSSAIIQLQASQLSLSANFCKCCSVTFNCSLLAHGKILTAFTPCLQAHLDPADRSRIERLEIFDEFEEWHMIQVRQQGQYANEGALSAADGCTLSQAVLKRLHETGHCAGHIITRRQLKKSQVAIFSWLCAARPRCSSADVCMLLEPHSFSALTAHLLPPCSQEHYCITVGLNIPESSSSDSVSRCLEGLGFGRGVL